MELDRLDRHAADTAGRCTRRVLSAVVNSLGLPRLILFCQTQFSHPGSAARSLITTSDKRRATFIWRGYRKNENGTICCNCRNNPHPQTVNGRWSQFDIDVRLYVSVSSSGTWFWAKYGYEISYPSPSIPAISANIFPIPTLSPHYLSPLPSP